MVEVRTQMHEEVDRLVDSGKIALENNQLKDAHRLFREAYTMNPESPHAASYYGYTMAMVEDKVHKGIELGIAAIKSSVPDPMFYLNIGLLYIKLNKKREAVGALKKGLEIDRSNKKIFQVWNEKLGWRRPPAIPFLPRGNFLNVLIGKQTYKGKRR